MNEFEIWTLVLYVFGALGTYSACQLDAVDDANPMPRWLSIILAVVWPLVSAGMSAVCLYRFMTES